MSWLRVPSVHLSVLLFGAPIENKKQTDSPVHILASTSRAPWAFRTWTYMNHFRGSQKNPKVNRFSLSNECDSSATFLSSPVLPMICAAKTPTTVEKPIKRSLSKYANIKSSITGSRNAAILGAMLKMLEISMVQLCRHCNTDSWLWTRESWTYGHSLRCNRYNPLPSNPHHPQVSGVSTGDQGTSDSPRFVLQQLLQSL